MDGVMELPMKAGTNMTIAGKTVYVFVLLSITTVMTLAAPPRLSLYCDEQGSPVCEAAVGKPPAQLLWVPESSSSAEVKHHDNGTVTVLSKFTACSTNGTNEITCTVSHPARNWSQSIACCSSGKSECFLHCVISFTSLMSLLFLLAGFQLYTFFNRTM